MSTYLKRTRVLTAALLLAFAMAFGLASTSQAYAEQQMKVGSIDATLLDSQEAATVDDVLAAIGQLSIDPRDYTVADIDRVEAIQADYEALSAEDQATIDSTFNHPSGDGQSYGRILEAAVWAVRSFGTDTSTTLDNGTYTTTTENAVSSVSSKGKSDSSRVRNWWVESVEVVNGQAIAYIYVTSGEATASKLTSYPSVWIGGQTIDRDENKNYAIPVDLNGVTYFGGISSSMPRPVMYALTTTIAEPVELTITNNASMFSVDATKAAVLMRLGENETLTVPMKSSTKFTKAFVGGKAEAEVATDTVAISSDKKFTFQSSAFQDGKPVIVCFYSASSDTWAERVMKLDRGAKSLVFENSEADYTAVDAAITSAPAEQGSYTDASWQELQAAISAVVRGKLLSQQAEVDAMAKAINDAIDALAIPVNKPVAKTGLVYNGNAQTGVAAAAGYTVTGGSATNAGSYTATAKLAKGYQWSDGTTADKTVKWSIAKATIAIPSAKIGLVYSGKTQTGVAAGAGYTVTGGSDANAGDHTATLTAKANYQFTGGKATATVKWSIAKAANPLKIANATRTAKATTAKKTVLGAKIKKKGQGKVTYTKVKVNKKKYKNNFIVNKKTGKITVKKGTPKGTYKVTVKAVAKGNTNYNQSAAKKAVVTIKVK